MLGTNPEKASNIMACRKIVNYFMAAVIPIYSLHFAKYYFPIKIQMRKSFERLLSTMYTANVSFLLHAFKELGSSLYVKPLLALQEKLRVSFLHASACIFLLLSRITRVNCTQYGVFSRMLRSCNAAIHVARTVSLLLYL